MVEAFAVCLVVLEAGGWVLMIRACIEDSVDDHVGHSVGSKGRDGRTSGEGCGGGAAGGEGLMGSKGFGILGLWGVDDLERMSWTEGCGV